MRFSKAPIIATLMAAALLALVALPALAGTASKTDRYLNTLGVGVFTANEFGGLTNSAADTLDDPTAGLGSQITVSGTGGYTFSDDAETMGADDRIYVSNRYKAGTANWVVVGVFDDTTNPFTDGTADPDNVSLADPPPTGAKSITEITVTNGAIEREMFDLNVAASAGTVAFAVVHPDTPVAAAYTSAGVPCAVLATGGAACRAYAAASGDDPEVPSGSYIYTGSTTAETGVRAPSNVTEATDFAPANHIVATDGDVLTITHGNNSVDLVVDGVGPAFSNLTPHGHTQSRSRVTLEFTVTDEGSGLVPDDDVADTDGNKKEPFANTAYGASRDIAVLWGIADELSDSAVAESNNGADDIDFQTVWSEVDNGYEGAAVFVEPKTPGRFGWALWAKDRVGNQSFTDRDRTKDERNYTLTVDDASPEVSQVRTGKAYDTDKDDGSEKSDRSSIAVTFVNEGTTTFAEKLNSGTVDASDFSVAGHVVTGVTLNKARNIVYLALAADLAADERPRVQVLAAALEDAAGNLNNAGDEQHNIVDEIAPKFTVNVTGDGDSGRPVAEEEFTATIMADERIQGSPVVTLVTIANIDPADRNTPQSDPDEVDWRIADTAMVQVTTTGLTSWEVTFGPSPLNLTNDRGLVGVIVSGEDRAAGNAKNLGFTAGWEGSDTKRQPRQHDTLDVAKMDAAGLLVEFDNQAPVADVTISPDDGSDPADRQSESTRPFLELDFASEGKEFTVKSRMFTRDDDDDMVRNGGEDDVVGTDPVGTTTTIVDGARLPQRGAAMNCMEATTDEGCPNPAADDYYESTDENVDKIVDGDDETDVDSQSRVEITAISVNGMDAMGALARLSSSKFTLAVGGASGLSVGTHTLTYTAVDRAGNETEDQEVKFEILPRDAYEVSLRPGWNLISLPANPADTSIDSVLPSGHPSTSVLSYQNGEWVSAARGEDGMWAGTLTDITAGPGYFVQTGGFQSLEVAIPEADPTSLLPTVAVVQGWNLLGVVDTAQRDAGDPTVLADTYFASIEWRVAHTFNTQSNRWSSISKGGTMCNTASDAAAAAQVDCVRAGSGYWVWVTKAGTLVPPF